MGGGAGTSSVLPWRAKLAVGGGRRRPGLHGLEQDLLPPATWLLRVPALGQDTGAHRLGGGAQNNSERAAHQGEHNSESTERLEVK